MTAGKAHLAGVAFEPSPFNARTTVVRPPAAAPYVLPPMRPDGRRERPYVAIVGAGHGKEEAPTDDPHWEVWALNVVPVWDSRGRLRADRWFELHEMHAQSADDIEWIAERCPVPLYLPPQAFDREGRLVLSATARLHVPHALPLPLARLEARFGAYWACTFAYQIALALDEGFERIGLFGMELAYGTERERTVEWACVSFWAGLASGLGVALHLPERSRIGRHPFRYGLEYDEEKASTERYLAFSRQLHPEEGVGG